MGQQDQRAKGVPVPVTRLHVEGAFDAGQAVALHAEQAHYLRSVLREGVGTVVSLFNAQSGEWRGEITQLSKSAGTVVLSAQSRTPGAEPDLWLCFAPIKRARIDFIAEKAAELGVSRLVPVITRFTQMSRVNTDRLRANAKEAAEQCERLSVPEVMEPLKFHDLIGQWPEERQLILGDETGEGPPIAEALQAKRYEKQAVLIGPEGGFAPEELDAVRGKPFVTAVSLGPRVLRADTAALAALACVQALSGDWRDGRPDFRAGLKDTSDPSG